MEEEKKTMEMEEKINEQIDKKIKSILEQGIQAGNVDFLYKMVDIKKDMAKIKKIEEDDEEMMYGNYGRGSYRAGGSSRSSRGGSYSAGGSYGEYGEGGSYGRRGVPGSGRGRYRGGQGSGNYRGEELMDEMMYHYGNYSESGQYGAEGEKMEALKNLMESAVEYFEMLKENVDSPKEAELMKHYFKKLSEI